jgi:acetolactate synthase I/III small subunit
VAANIHCRASGVSGKSATLSRRHTNWNIVVEERSFFMKHTFSVLLQNRPGVLSRVTGLFSGRGFNIESLCVAETMDPNVSCLTVVSRGEAAIIEQINKQLNKLIDVIKVTEINDKEFVEREMVLIKVKAEASTRAEVLRIVDIFRGKVVDVSAKSYAIELTGSASKIQAVLDILRPIGIKEIVRTGTIAMARANKNK